MKDHQLAKPFFSRYLTRMFVAAHFPELFIILMKTSRRLGFSHTKGEDFKIVGEGKTDIVIDGYPRSSNTFAFFAFQLAQNKECQVAHHLHASSQFIIAARQNIPNLLVIRNPEDAIISFLIYSPRLSFHEVLLGYCYFHEPLIKFVDQIVVGTFEEVTTDFGQIIDKVNHRWGRHFELFEHSQENENKCFELADQDRLIKNSSRHKNKKTTAILTRATSRPSMQRHQLKQKLLNSYFDNRYRALRLRADAAYHALINSRIENFS
jgi:hypothetical protein